MTTLSISLVPEDLQAAGRSFAQTLFYGMLSSAAYVLVEKRMDDEIVMPLIKSIALASAVSPVACIFFRKIGDPTIKCISAFSFIKSSLFIAPELPANVCALPIGVVYYKYFA